MNWLTRALWSLLCVLGCAFTVGVAASISGALSPTGFDAAGLFEGAVWIVVYSLPGWVVALPIVLTVGNYSGWRRWAWGVVGISLGPAVILLAFLWASLDGGGWKDFSGSTIFFVYALAVSVPTTVTYLLLAGRSPKLH